jgi:hypothetical protein
MAACTAAERVERLSAVKMTLRSTRRDANRARMESVSRYRRSGSKLT